MILPRKLLILISVLIFILFVFFSYLVAKETFTKLDFDLTVKFQDRLPRRLDTPFTIFSVLGSAEVTGLIWITLTLYILIKRYWLTFFSMALLPIALLIEIYGKVFVYHPAPPHLFYRGTFSFNLPSHYVQTEYSYPSGHMTRTAFLLTFLIGYFYLKLPIKCQFFIQPVLIAVYLGMAISRIYLAEHWTSDVLGGALLGSALGLFSAATVRLKKSKVKNEALAED